MISSTVLLANCSSALPPTASVRSLAVIGPADTDPLTGVGGSSYVDPGTCLTEIPSGLSWTRAGHLRPASRAKMPARTRIPAAISAAYGLNAKGKRMKAAPAFADFLGSAAGQNAYNRAGAILPAIPNDHFDVKPALAAIAEHQRAGKTMPFMDQLWLHLGVEKELFEQMKLLFAGCIMVEATLHSLDRAYTSES
ncbi:hypothetical protein [Streptomyces sp. NBC_00102]|uniref:hypothetical protein n=1 Tax=Streptomyces sp. NBC_00102 TaxID=2975652 RepID=UPI00225AFC99|nr:hypothetical protein [Streptomyces sp. NBC_00102]MCX5402352.1 hypothetical protein [Streptomyces sp. NBC_00102]